jgi:hypothetical protein
MKGRKTTIKEQRELLRLCKDERRRVFNALKNHLLKGLSIDCFAALSETEIRKMIVDYPEEWCIDELEQTQRQAKDYWETLGRDQARGTCLGNSRSWYYNMSNRYGWSDRQKIDQEVKGAVSVSIVNYAQPKAATD